MQIVDEQIRKMQAGFKALDLPEAKIEEHVEKLKNAILMDMAAEAMAEKGIVSDDMSFNQDEVEDFLLDNYEEEELAEINRRVARDVAVHYFSKLLGDASEEQVAKVEDLLAASF